MGFGRVPELRGLGVRLVVTDVEAGDPRESDADPVCKPRLLPAPKNRCVPWTRDTVAGERRCEGMDAQECRTARAQPVERRVDGIVIGPEAGRDPIVAGVCIQPDIAGNDRAVTVLEDRRF